MRSWWEQRNPREKLLLSSVGLVLIVLLCYVLLWQPFQISRTNLQQNVMQLRDDLAWMQQASAKIQYLRQTQTAATANANANTNSSNNRPSLPTLIDQTARNKGLGKALKRVEPQAAEQLQVQFERVGFDQMLQWLNDLQREHGVVIVNIVINRQDAPGRVNARLILQGSG